MESPQRQLSGLDTAIKALSVDTDLPLSPGVMTPSTEPNDAQGISEDAQMDNYALGMRWQEALERCRSSLRGAECQIVLSFTGPDQLAADLKRREREYEDSLRHQLIAQIYPHLRFMQNLSGVFLSVMRPTLVETALVWGVLHLAIKGAADSTVTFAKLVDMINKIHREMALFTRYASVLNGQPEMRHALVDMFVALINFWSEAVTFFRRSTMGQLVAESWPQLNTQFQNALNEMNRSVDVVYKLASLTKLETEAEINRQNNADIINMISKDSNETARAAFPCYYGFHVDPNFLGRRKELDEIRLHLEPTGNVDFRSFVIHGIGGMGKSALACAFAVESQKNKTYDAIFWIPASNAAELRDSFTKIALCLDLVGASRLADADSNVVLVKNWLGRATKKCLLIYDNVESLVVLSDFLPPSSGSVLITTRVAHIAVHAPGIRESEELNELELSEGIALFNNLRTRYSKDNTCQSFDEAADIEHLIKELGGLALGIEQMAAYIGSRKWTVPEFLAKYRKMDKMAEKINSKHEGRAHSLATVWEMHFQYFKGKSASKFLGMLSIIGPDNIPIELFVPEELRVIDPYSDFCAEEADVEEAIDELMRFALIKCKGSTLSLHRLIQRAFIFSPSGLDSSDRQVAFNAVTKLLNHRFPKGSPLFQKWEVCAKYLHHVLALAELFKTLKATKRPMESSPDFDELIMNASWYQYEIGDLEASLNLLMLGFDICQDKEGILYGFYCNHAACIYYELNDLVRCREVLEKSQKIREARGDPIENELANTYSNMSNLLLSESLLDEALMMNEKAMTLRATIVGTSSTYFALSHMMKGRIHAWKKEYDIASEWYQKSADVFVDAGEGESWLRGCLFYDLGNMELAREELLAAKSKYESAFNIAHNLGPTQVLTGSIHYKMGVVEVELGNFETASNHYCQALTIAKYRKMSGHIARTIRRQALLLEKRGNLSELELNEVKRLKLDAEALRVKTATETNMNLQQQYQTEDDAYDNLICGYFR